MRRRGDCEEEVEVVRRKRFQGEEEVVRRSCEKETKRVARRLRGGSGGC